MLYSQGRDQRRRNVVAASRLTGGWASSWANDNRSLPRLASVQCEICVAPWSRRGVAVENTKAAEIYTFERRLACAALGG